MFFCASKMPSNETECDSQMCMLDSRIEFCPLFVTGDLVRIVTARSRPQKLIFAATDDLQYVSTVTLCTWKFALRAKLWWLSRADPLKSGFVAVDGETANKVF